MIIEKVKNTIIKNHLIEIGDYIVIGLSGGPDSVCLFHALYQLKKQFNLTLYGVHINHKLRPGAAEEDQSYVEELCKNYNVKCHIFTFDIYQIAKKLGTSSEDAGRQMRYQSFYKVANAIKSETGASVKIAVAQNLNDQAETILMRIMRGTGTDGLAGIEYIRKEEGEAPIIRPILDITREEIENYCKDNNLNPRIDLTNLEPIYTRNKIRLELLPYMKDNFNENILMAFQRLSKIAKEDKDYMNQLVDEILTDNAACEKSLDRISVDLLLKLHPAIRHRMIIRIFERIGLTKDIGWIHLENADKLLTEGRTSSSVDFSNGFAMRISYGFAEFYKKDDNLEQSFEYAINVNGITDISELNSKLEVKLLVRTQWENYKIEKNHSDKGIYRCSINFDEIKKSQFKLLIRTRRQGDYITPLGMKGRKKLQDLFVDEKIKKENRSNIPLICLGSEIIWVIGSRMNEKYKIFNETENILLLEYSNKI